MSIGRPIIHKRKIASAENNRLSWFSENFNLSKTLLLYYSTKAHKFRSRRWFDYNFFSKETTLFCIENSHPVCVHSYWYRKCETEVERNKIAKTFRAFHILKQRYNRIHLSFICLFKSCIKTSCAYCFREHGIRCRTQSRNLSNRELTARLVARKVRNTCSHCLIKTSDSKKFDIKLEISFQKRSFRNWYSFFAFILSLVKKNLNKNFSTLKKKCVID